MGLPAVVEAEAEDGFAARWRVLLDGVAPVAFWWAPRGIRDLHSAVTEDWPAIHLFPTAAVCRIKEREHRVTDNGTGNMRWHENRTKLVAAVERERASGPSPMEAERWTPEQDRAWSDEGLAIAIEMKRELPDWTVVYDDGWRAVSADTPADLPEVGNHRSFFEYEVTDAVVQSGQWPTAGAPGLVRPQA